MKWAARLKLRRGHAGSNETDRHRQIYNAQTNHSTTNVQTKATVVTSNKLHFDYMYRYIFSNNLII